MMRSSTTRTRTRHYRLVFLRVERLDDRALPSATITEPVYPVIMAGNPKGSPIDSASNRVDPNTTDSPFAGVGSILVSTKKSTIIGTGTAIGPRQILTAAHVVDLNADGRVDARDGTQGVYFVLNYGENESHRIAVSQFDLHPDYTGFNHPAVNDDIAVLTLAEDLPEGVPIYALPTTDLSSSATFTMVGYGRSGDGLRGYTTFANPTIKRVGENVVDGFYGQDDQDRPASNEVFRFDFDSPKGNGPLGGPTLGNDIETQLGAGDSGGPSFLVTDEGGYVLAGVNTFVQGNAPKFGSMGGGMNVFSYLGFIQSVLPYDPSRDLGNEPGPVSEPAPIGGVPITDPSITPTPALPPAKAGVRIGAKPVSFEMSAVFSRDFTVRQESAFAIADSDEKKDEFVTVIESQRTESGSFEEADSTDSLDSLKIDGLVSVDLGLLSFATDGSLSVQE